MLWFEKILVICDQENLSEFFLEKLAIVARKNEAELTFVVPETKMPSEFDPLLKEHEQSFEANIKSKLENHNIKSNPNFVYEDSKAVFIPIIQRVLREDFDLIMKPAPPHIDKGFRSLDMSLLRKCPCPVWIEKNEDQEHQKRLVVAIDALQEEKGAQDLSVQLLKIGNALSKLMSYEFHVISCWHVEYESMLRHSAFVKVEEEKLNEITTKTQKDHESAFENLVSLAEITRPDKIHLPNGKPDEIIPGYINDNDIDLAVMGTVARTGIPGFFIGNTAENIIQNITCSMIAVKPNGFVTPIKAY